MNNIGLDNLPFKINSIKYIENSHKKTSDNLDFLIVNETTIKRKISIFEEIKNVKESNEETNLIENFVKKINKSIPINNKNKILYQNNLDKLSIENYDNEESESENKKIINSENENENEMEPTIKRSKLTELQKMKLNSKKIKKFYDKNRKFYPYMFKLIKKYNKNYYYEENDLSNKFSIK